MGTNQKSKVQRTRHTGMATPSLQLPMAWIALSNTIKKKADLLGRPCSKIILQTGQAMR
jgi:hypothetical protein